MDVFFTSTQLDEEVLAKEKYQIFSQLRAIDGVEVAHFKSEPKKHEKGASEILGFVLKAVALGAVTQLIDIFSERIIRKPDIRVRIGELELETSDLTLKEVRELLSDIIRKGQNRLIV